MPTLTLHTLACRKQEDVFGKDDLVLLAHNGYGDVHRCAQARLASGETAQLDDELEFEDELELELIENDGGPNALDADDVLGRWRITGAAVQRAVAGFKGGGFDYELTYSVAADSAGTSEPAPADQTPAEGPAAEDGQCSEPDESEGSYKSGYYYDEPGREHPIYIEIGLHGLDAQAVQHERSFFPDDDPEHGPDDPVDPLYVPEGAKAGAAAGPSAASRQHLGSEMCSSLSNRGIVEFIYFGKSHRYYVEDYKRVAPQWRDNLFKEARIVVRSLQMDQSIAHEFFESDGSLGAWMTHGLNEAWRGTIGRWASKPEKLPKPEEFDPLIRKAFKVWSRIKKSTADDYGVLHAAGIDFMRVRWHQERLNTRMQRRLDELITTAEWGEKISTEVESVAFTVLDLYGQARYGKNPAALAAYRCGVLLVRCTARYTGEKIAENSQRTAVASTGKIVRAELPGILTDLFLGYVKRGYGTDKLSPSQELAQQVLGIQIWFFFQLIDFYVFEKPELSKTDQQRANDLFLEKLLPDLGVQVFSAILAVGLAKAGEQLPENSRKLVWVGKIVTAMTTLVSSGVREYVAFRKIAAAEKREVLDVILSDLGWSIVRVAKDLAKAFAKEVTQDWMKKRIVMDRDFWKAYFLSLKLQLAELNMTIKEPEPIIQSIDGPLPPPESRGPSPEDGSVGAAKTPLAIIQEPSGQEPPKRGEMADKNPTRDERKDEKGEERLTDAQAPRTAPPQGTLSNKERKKARLRAKAAAKAKAKAKAAAAAGGSGSPPDAESGGSDGGGSAGGGEGPTPEAEGEEGPRSPTPEERRAALKAKAIEEAKKKAAETALANERFQSKHKRDSLDRERRTAEYVRDDGAVEVTDADSVTRTKLGLPESEICCDVLGTAPGKVWFAESKGSDLDHAIEQLENAWRAYKVKNPGADPRFIVSIPIDVEPRSGRGLRVSGSSVRRDKKRYRIDGKGVDVLWLGRKVK